MPTLALLFLVPLVALAAACSSAATPTPTAGDVAGSPVETPTPTAGDVAGVRTSMSSGLVIIAGDALQQKLIRDVEQLEGVSRVHSYLEVTAKPNTVMGVSGGAPLIVPGGQPVTVRAGEPFSGSPEGVAIPGVGVDANPYGSGMAGTMMAHRFQVGQTFELHGQRLRVIGLYEADREQEGYILLPLATAQRLFDREGIVTTIVVTVDPPQRASDVRSAVQRLLQEAE